MDGMEDSMYVCIDSTESSIYQLIYLKRRMDEWTNHERGGVCLW